MRVQILKNSRVTASLHGITGTITRERSIPLDCFQRPITKWDKKMFWMQFDSPQRGAGSIMTGVWLEDSMFTKK